MHNLKLKNIRLIKVISKRLLRIAYFLNLHVMNFSKLLKFQIFQLLVHTINMRHKFLFYIVFYHEIFFGKIPMYFGTHAFNR